MLTDTEARRTATEWAGGSERDLTALSTSGAIGDKILFEIEYVTRRFAETSKDRENLTKLAVYCLNKGMRGPVEGWANLNY